MDWRKMKLEKWMHLTLKWEKNLQMKGWLEGQEAEFDSLIWDTQESLRETFDSTNRLDTRMKSHKLHIKSGVSQVFSMAA